MFVKGKFLLVRPAGSQILLPIPSATPTTPGGPGNPPTPAARISGQVSTLNLDTAISSFVIGGSSALNWANT